MDTFAMIALAACFALLAFDVQAPMTVKKHGGLLFFKIGRFGGSFYLSARN